MIIDNSIDELQTEAKRLLNFTIEYNSIRYADYRQAYLEDNLRKLSNIKIEISSLLEYLIRKQ